uniref:ribonuclease H n=1 Tax=Mycena chlorophos TaxID=658473 RepID=A0ABQ0M5V9_MYCCL|nr:predicted protein [Mycena chlorophos]
MLPTSTLEGKWDPRVRQPEDTEQQLDIIGTRNVDENTETFNPRVTTHGTTADGFRLFADERAAKALPIIAHHREDNNPEVVVHTDGSATNNGIAEARAGSGIYFGPGDPRNRALRIPDEWGPSNQVGELAAIKEAAEMCPKGTPLKIVSNSRYAINAVTKYLQKTEDNGFLPTANGELIALTVASLQVRCGKTTLQWVKGHAGDEGNKAANALAVQGAAKDTPDKIRQGDMNLVERGVKLRTITQSKAEDD